MDFWEKRAQKMARNAPLRLYKALPSVLLAVLLNTMDAVSTGFLIFPPSDDGKAFKGLQVEAISLYLMSTITSQIAMTLGGSLFPGALGQMLIEIFPFLRSIARSIRDALGDDNPSVLPTVMAAYALTSFLTGMAFIVLGGLKCGRLVEYFPRTVLQGVIGAIGVALFLSGLEQTLPPTSSSLSISTAKDLLFNTNHLPLLFASLFPAILLWGSIRSKFAARITRGATQHPFFTPFFVIIITAVFWTVVAGIKLDSKEGMAHLVDKGWLFHVEDEVLQQKGIGTAWMYWRLYDFRKVQWWALRRTVPDMLLLVVIGVLNFPIYIGALALSLNIPSYNMDHELLGQGAANFLSGVVGSLPNQMVFLNSMLFTKAGGRRFEAMLVTIFTFVFLLLTGIILRYLPTITPACIVMYLGMELMFEVLWDSTKILLWSEWGVVTSTTVACVLLGFAPGFGVGIGVAMLAHFVWGILDSRGRSLDISASPRARSEIPAKLEGHSPQASQDVEAINEDSVSDSNNQSDRTSTIRIIKVSGYAFFATIPSLEREMAIAIDSPLRHVILDLSQVHRLETNLVDYLVRKGKELAARLKPVILVLSGVEKGSGAFLDLERGGLVCLWDGYDLSSETEGYVCFEDLVEAARWCQDTHKHLWPAPTKRASSSKTFVAEADLQMTQLSDGSNAGEFKYLFSLEDPLQYFPTQVDGLDIGRAERLENLGFKCVKYNTDDIILQRGQSVDRVLFVLRGRVALVNGQRVSSPSTSSSRSSLRRIVSQAPSTLLHAVSAVLFRHRLSTSPDSHTLPMIQKWLISGDPIGIPNLLHGNFWNASDRVVASGRSPCYVMEIQRSDANERDWTVILGWAARVAILSAARREEEKLWLGCYL
ncbi:sulfate transporter family-domain-containing protein [Crucibulum laeve]|uniref:Sulfate transporter family-domain-containing protein n=1 Tax=Crucibulum laeve TaxID=68775 RepID=A0A5C3LWK2_9AGAR|nr:sulfate transporter family-domain-containing protein [Crucibulum laeve]